MHEGGGGGNEHRGTADQLLGFVEASKRQHQPSQKAGDAGNEQGKSERPGGLAAFVAEFHDRLPSVLAII